MAPAVTSPLLPGEASTVLRVVAVLIGLGGALRLVGLALLLVSPLLGQPAVITDLRGVFVVVVLAGLGIGYCLTGIWLFQARRRGAYLAFGALALNLLGILLDATPISGWKLIQPVVALIGLALAWPHLSDEGHEVVERVSVLPRAG